jgi:LysR family hydrogen peroxide-inducible transcriptional activator
MCGSSLVLLLPELAAMTLANGSRGLLHPLEAPVPAREVSLVTHGEGVRIRLLEILKRSILKGLPDGLKNADSVHTMRIIGARKT